MDMAAKGGGPGGPSYWAARWREGRTGWDQNGPHPALAELITVARESGWLPSGSRILEPGCGRAHGGAALAKEGWRVTSFDAVAEAIASAGELYKDIDADHLELRVQDALVTVPEWQGRYDAIYDRAFLCALPRDVRKAYVRASFDHLKPGGLFLTIPFTELKIPESEGPPFQVTMQELAELMASGFSLEYAKDRRLDGDSKLACETPCIWRRRARKLVESV